MLGAATDPTPNGDVGFHQNWYPVALASDLDESRIVGKDFLGGRVVLYRDAAGRPVVQGAYCPHLGADLSVGDIVDGHIRCAYHHWTFDGTGACTRIPAGDKIPPAARLFTYPSVEAWGLVWAFNGERPWYEAPRIPGITQSEVIARTYAMPGPSPFEPWLPVSNAVDFQHLRALHGIDVDGPDHVEMTSHGIEWTLEHEGERRHGLVTGTNTFALYVLAGGFESFMLFTGSPIRRGESFGYYVVGLRETSVPPGTDRQVVMAQVDELAAFAARLLEEDGRVLRTIRFRPKVLVASDRFLARYLKYVREFPRADFAD